jgi:hypothetical protein
MSDNELAHTPFIRDIIARYGEKDYYVRDLVLLEATLRQPRGKRADLAAKCPLERLVILSELVTGHAITPEEVTLLRRAAKGFGIGKPTHLRTKR